MKSQHQVHPSRLSRFPSWPDASSPSVVLALPMRSKLVVTLDLHCYVYLMYDDIRHNNQGAFALTQSMKHHKDEFKFKLRGTQVKSKTDKPYIVKPKDYSVQNGPYIPKCSPNRDR